MGKSRTVDELGKKHFSIPINLRDAKSTGIFFFLRHCWFCSDQYTCAVSFQAILLPTMRFEIF